MSLDYDFHASDLDEFLVEYVDGTMDPVVREAFEEFLRVYPEVAEQVDCLATVRSQLCRLGDKCRCHAPPGFQDRLKEQLLVESSAGSGMTPETLATHLNMVALAFSLTLLLLAVVVSASVAPSEADDTRATLVTETRAAALDASLGLKTAAPRTTNFTRSVALSRESHWHVSHTHPGSREIHVDAAFDRPILLSVRRDLVALRPVVDSPHATYTLP